MFPGGRRKREEIQENKACIWLLLGRMIEIDVKYVRLKVLHI